MSKKHTKDRKIAICNLYDFITVTVYCLYYKCYTPIFFLNVSVIYQTISSSSNYSKTLNFYIYYRLSNSVTKLIFSVLLLGPIYKKCVINKNCICYITLTIFFCSIFTP